MKQLILSIAIFSGVATMTAYRVFPQSEQSTRFEVASIRINNSGGGRSMMPPFIGGRLTAVNVTLTMLVRVAYKMKDYQVLGGPAWINSDRLDISAKAESDLGSDQMLIMLQSLLRDRFKLAVHRATKDLPLYELVNARSQPVIQRSKETPCVTLPDAKAMPPLPHPGQKLSVPPVPCGGFVMLGNGLEGARVSMRQLAGALSDMLRMPVVDKTGFTETFDVHLTFDQQPYPAGQGAPGGPAVAASPANSLPQADAPGLTIFTAVQQQLGIKLVSAKGPVEVIVIDHVEKPSAN